MPRYVAFLRAINVGGRRLVRMEQLRTLFGSLGLSDVETFIASGNVIFNSPAADVVALERKIEAKLHASLGYPVATFVRSADELTAIGRHRPFGEDPVPVGGGAVHVIFLSKALTPTARKQLLALRSDEDDFAVKGREVYWLRRGKLLESPVSGAVMERSLGSFATMRNRNTVVRLIAKLELTLSRKASAVKRKRRSPSEATE
jgi:uncharacterized protein (DUF1697 family)